MQMLAANNSSIGSGKFGTPYSRVYETFGYITLATGIVAVSGSLLCAWTIIKNRTHQKSSSNILFLNLCLATLLFGVIVCPLHAYTQIAQSGNYFALKSNRKACQFLGFTYFWTFTASAYSHSAIAMNRLFAVAFHDCRSNTGWMTGSLIVATWVVSGVTFAPPLFGAGASYGFSSESMKCTFEALKSVTYVVTFKVMYGFVPFIIMSLCYAGVFVKVLISSQRIRLSQRVAAIDPGRTGLIVKTARKRRALSGEVRVTKIAFVTCLVFAGCYVPSAVYGFVVKTREEIQSPLGIGLVSLMWFGCAFNPLLYTYLNSAYRNKIMQWLALKPIIGSWISASHGSTEMTSKGHSALERLKATGNTMDS